MTRKENQTKFRQGCSRRENRPSLSKTLEDLGYQGGKQLVTPLDQGKGGKTENQSGVGCVYQPAQGKLKQLRVSPTYWEGLRGAREKYVKLKKNILVPHYSDPQQSKPQQSGKAGEIRETVPEARAIKTNNEDLCKIKGRRFSSKTVTAEKLCNH